MDNQDLDFSQLDTPQRWAGRILRFLPLMQNAPPKISRKIFAGFDRLLGLNKIPLAKVEDWQIPIIDDNNHQLKIRVYYPQLPDNESNTQAKITNAMVYFHGGGGVIGSIETHDRFCRYLAHYGQHIIISVDYRLAPEHPYPTALIDAIASWNWVVENKEKLAINHCQLGVGGDSAGGYLALVLGLVEDQQQLPIQVIEKPAFQFLICPMTDLRRFNNNRQRYEKNLLLTNKVMAYFKSYFFHNFQQNNEKQTVSLFNPFLSQYLQNSPKTYLLTVQFDPLFESGIAYTEQLQALGVTVKQQHFADSMHQFFSLARVSKQVKKHCITLAKDLAQLNTI